MVFTSQVYTGVHTHRSWIQFQNFGCRKYRLDNVNNKQQRCRSVAKLIYDFVVCTCTEQVSRCAVHFRHTFRILVRALSQFSLNGDFDSVISVFFRPPLTNNLESPREIELAQPIRKYHCVLGFPLLNVLLCSQKTK